MEQLGFVGRPETMGTAKSYDDQEVRGITILLPSQVQRFMEDYGFSLTLSLVFTIPVPLLNTHFHLQFTKATNHFRHWLIFVKGLS